MWAKKKLPACVCAILRAARAGTFLQARCFWGSDISRTPRCLKASLKLTRTDIWLRRRMFLPKCRGFLLAEMCRIGGTGRPSPRLVRGAWLRLKSRNIWKRRGTEGEKSLPQRTQRYRGNTEIQRAPQRYRGNTEIQRANRDTEERRDTEGTEL